MPIIPNVCGDDSVLSSSTAMLDVWLVVLPTRDIKGSHSDQGYDRDRKLEGLMCSYEEGSGSWDVAGRFDTGPAARTTFNRYT